MTANRYRAHDDEQAKRRTPAQNRQLIEIIRDHGGTDIWAYTDVPPEGGPVTLNYPAEKRGWTIEPDGSVIEHG